MAENRINAGAPATANVPSTSTGAAPPKPAATEVPAPASNPDTGRILPRNWSESLQGAAQRGQEYLQEGFNRLAGRPQLPADPPQGPAISSPNTEAIFGNPIPKPDMAGLRIENPTNPASFPQPKTMFDLANFSMSSYGGGPDQGKIALYSAGTTPEGRPVVLVDITGTEFDFSGQRSNLPSNWGAAGTGAVTDLELQVVGAIQDAYKRGEIPKDAVIDLTGHSLGAIIANNISGRPNADGYDGLIDVASAEGEKSTLPIRNVIGFGTPKPSIWSENVNYFQRVGYADIVANLPTDEVAGTRLSEWKQDTNGPNRFDREQVRFHIPKNDMADGGHLQYNKNPAENPLAKEGLPPALQYSDGLKLIGAYRNPAMGEPPPVRESVRELERELLSPRIQQELDRVFPRFREWMGTELSQNGEKLPDGIRNQIGNSLNAVFETYFDSERFKNAGPEERREIIKQDEARLRDVVKKIATPLANELARQTVVDWWKDNVKLPWQR